MCVKWMPPRFGNVAIFLCATCAWLVGANAGAETLTGRQVERTLSLVDLGLSEPAALNNRGVEQHFYFPVPQGVELKDARVEIRGKYLHPFPEAAAITLLANGEPVFSHRLPGGEGGFFLKMVDLNGAVFNRGNSGDEGDEIDISLPLGKLRPQGGFLDLGVVLSRQVDATRCIDERGRGNELSIDPAATRLVYSFAGGSVQDVRSLLSTLPRQPVILMPKRELSPVQYGAALRLSQAFSNMGLHPAFVALPKVGDVVDTALLAQGAQRLEGRISAEMGDAIAQRRKYKIAQPEEIAVWLALRMMSPDGLAHAVIDPAQVRQALLDSLQGADAKSVLGKKRWSELGLDEAANWLPDASLPKTNVRVAMLGGQPVLALEGASMEQAGDLVATIWREIAGSRELALETALHVSGQDNASPHVHFAPGLSVQNVAERSEWVIPVQLGGLPQGRWPDSFELNLMAAPSGDDQSPVVSVFMNDNLLTAVTLRTDGEITRLRAKIPLYALRADNQLRVEIRRRISGGHCSRQAQGFPVQLLPSSYLNLRDAPEATQFFMLGSEFGADSQIVVPPRYLQDSANTLPVVSSVLRGLAANGTGFKLVTDAKPGFKPAHTFVAFESAPYSDTEQVVTGSGKLLVRNLRDHTVFDSAGLGRLAVMQLIRSGKQQGVSVITVDGNLPDLRNPLRLSAGNLAIADADGVKLEINLDDPENDWQLDEQNRGALTFIQRYRTWFIILGLALLPVFAVFGLRWYFRNRQLKG